MTRPAAERPVEELDRTPPSDLEAEQAVLGAIMLNPSRLEIARKIVAAAAFHAKIHQVLFEAFCELPPPALGDRILLADALRARGKLEAVGGAEYLGRLLQKGTVAHTGYYAEIVLEKFGKRSCASFAADLLQAAYDDTVTTEQWYNTAAERLRKMSEWLAAHRRKDAEL